MENNNDFKKIAKKMFYTGLGAVSVAVETTGKVVDKLAQKGAEVASDNGFIQDGKKALKNIEIKIKNETDIVRTLSKMTREERDNLFKKLNEMKAAEEADKEKNSDSENE